MDWSNLSRLSASDQVKFVIKDRQDYEFAREIVAREQLRARTGCVLFSPVHGVMNARELAEWILADRLPVRLQLQAHKYIWPPDTRGV
jgi:7-carboxy-7-deazaguanine synthase